MKLIDIKPGDVLWSEVWEVYESSFPLCERRSADGHKAILDGPDYRARIAVDDSGSFLGLMFYWDTGDFLYIEHLAVNPDLRGQNIGSQLLGGFIEANPGRRMILEIDPPEDEISVRRLRFYERLGFLSNDYHYIHPGFGAPSEAIPHRLVLLSYPDPITPQEFARFERYVHEQVLADTGKN